MRTGLLKEDLSQTKLTVLTAMVVEGVCLSVTEPKVPLPSSF